MNYKYDDRSFKGIEKMSFQLHCPARQVQRIMNDFEKQGVVLFVSDYRLSSEEDVYNHYVAATRAKTKLILVYVNGEWSAGQFAKNINNILGKSGLKMKDVATIANCTECISD